MKKLFTFFTIAFALNANAQLGYQWAKGIGGTSSDNCRSITTDASSNVYITGYFQGTIDFDPSANTAVAQSPQTRQAMYI